MHINNFSYGLTVHYIPTGRAGHYPTYAEWHARAPETSCNTVPIVFSGQWEDIVAFELRPLSSITTTPTFPPGTGSSPTTS
jgi:hypothetical protein